MVKHIKQPAVIKAAGNKEKKIEEYFGRVNSGTSAISIAKMDSPEGWIEPGQEPEFDEYTLVLKGCLQVKTKSKTILVNEGEAILIPKNQWVQYSSPFEGGAQYVAICMPAFAPDIVHRDNE